MTSRPALRIAIACYPTYGGSGIVATELGIALAQRGHRVHLIAYDEPPRLRGSSLVDIHLVKVSAYPLFKYPPYDLAVTSRLTDLLEGEGLDVIHAHYAIPHAICALLSRNICPSSSPLVVTTLHGTDITVVGSDPTYRSVTRYALRGSDAVVCVSEFLARTTRSLFDTERDLHVLPNFVDTERFRPRAARRDGPARLAHLSNFREVKRPLDVIEAFALGFRGREARLLLVGEGPLLPACLARARELRVEDQIVALGARDDPEDLLPDVDVLLQPSGSEAFGLAALEAMACGVPVVGYAVGGLPEVVVDGQTGYLVPFRDVQTLAMRARRLVDHPSLRERMGRAGRQRAETVFARERAVERHEDLYFSLLRNRR